MQAFGNISSRRLQSSQYGASTLPAAPMSARSSADASFWLALRTGVLRRAISPSGTAPQRSAEVSASGAFTANLKQPQTCRPLCAGRCSRIAAARVARPVLGLSARFALRQQSWASGRTQRLHPQKNQLRSSSLAGPMASKRKRLQNCASAG